MARTPGFFKEPSLCHRRAPGASHWLLHRQFLPSRAHAEALAGASLETGVLGSFLNPDAGCSFFFLIKQFFMLKKIDLPDYKGDLRWLCTEIPGWAELETVGKVKGLGVLTVHHPF